MSEGLHRYIDIYCERLEPGLWAEPINAITNAAFFVAAFMVFLLARKENALNAQTGMLIFFVLAIGTGSTLFHTHATMWAQLSDSIPILFYQIAFLIFYANGVLKFSKLQTVLFFLAFSMTIIGIYQLPHHWLNGSIGYAPALIFLLLLAGIHYIQSKQKEADMPEGVKLLGLACITFIISLTFRSIDMQLCDAIPFGTHFLWHIFNGLVLYCTTRAYVVEYRK